MQNDFLKSLAVALVATGISYAIAFSQGWVTGIDWLEASATFVSFSAVYLFVMQKRVAYIVNTVAVILLFAFFYRMGFYGSAALQVYLLPTVLYGYWYWRADEVQRPVTRLRDSKNPLLSVLGYASVTLVAYLGAVYVQNYFGARMAGLDAGILVLSILSQFALDRKKLWAWIPGWLSVNVLSIYVYFQGGMYIVAIQMAAFLLNTLYGHYMWKKSYKAQTNVPANLATVTA